MKYIKLFKEHVNEGVFDWFQKKSSNLTDEEIEQKLCGLANSERVLVEYGKSPNPENTDKLTYTDLSDTSISDDFTPYYQEMKNYLIKNGNEITLKDEYNRKEFIFELDGDTLISKKI